MELPNGHRADRLARSTYFQTRTADSLYGPADSSEACRWHRVSQASVSDGSVLGVELLGFPHYASATEPTAHGQKRTSSRAVRRYLCVLHLALDLQAPFEALAVAVRLDPEDALGLQRRESYEEILGIGFEISSDVRRAVSVSMMTFQDQLWAPPDTPESWSAMTAWLWYAASATPLQNFSPDPEDPHALDGLVYLSSTWRALVLRDGVGFLGLNPDPDGKTGFFAWGESYVRSLYTDVVLLSALEHDALDGFAERLTRIGDRFEKSLEFRRLVNAVTEFRNVLWWEGITRHGNANTLLDQLHHAHHTARLFNRVIADLDAFRQQVEGHALEAAVGVQIAEEKRARRFEHAASVAAIAFGLPALVFTALAVPVRGLTSDGHALPVWVIILIGLGSLVLGASAGAAGGQWLSRKNR